mgnify:CR=1 FL=1
MRHCRIAIHGIHDMVGFWSRGDRADRGPGRAQSGAYDGHFSGWAQDGAEDNLDEAQDGAKKSCDFSWTQDGVGEEYSGWYSGLTRGGVEKFRDCCDARFPGWARGGAGWSARHDGWIIDDAARCESWRQASDAAEGRESPGPDWSSQGQCGANWQEELEELNATKLGSLCWSAEHEKCWKLAMSSVSALSAIVRTCERLSCSLSVMSPIREQVNDVATPAEATHGMQEHHGNLSRVSVDRSRRVRHHDHDERGAGEREEESRWCDETSWWIADGAGEREEESRWRDEASWWTADGAKARSGDLADWSRLEQSTSVDAAEWCQHSAHVGSDRCGSRHDCVDGSGGSRDGLDADEQWKQRGSSVGNGQCGPWHMREAGNDDGRDHCSDDSPWSRHGGRGGEDRCGTSAGSSQCGPRHEYEHGSP